MGGFNLYAILADYYTKADVDGLLAGLSGGGGGGGAAVTSVAGRTGDVVLAIADITSLQTTLDALAPLDSPALTGTPTAPTPAAGTSTTQLATCAFVATAIAALNLGTAATHAATDFDAAGAAAAVNTSLSTHTARTDNPHAVTKAQVGLGSVPNVDTTNATNIASGTLNVARLPTGIPNTSISGLGSMALQPSSNVTITGGTISVTSLTAPTIKSSNAGLTISTTNTRADTDGPDVTLAAAAGTDNNVTAVTTGASLTLKGGGADGGGAADATITPGTGGKFVVAGSATVTGTLTADGSSLTNLPAANLTGTIARDRLPTILHPGAVPQGRQWGPPYSSYSTSSRTVSSNTIYFVPLYFPPGTAVDTLGTSVRTAAGAGGKMRLGLYASVNGLPSTLVVDGGETASDGASPPYDAEVTLAGGAQTLTGWYWLAISVSGGCSVGSTAAGTGSWVMGSQPGGNANASVSYASTYGPLPSSIVQASLSFATTVLPWGYARKA